MKKLLLVSLCLIFTFSLVNSQVPLKSSYIRDMQWDKDNQIHLTLSNDSSYTVKVEDIYHSSTYSADSAKKDFVYYPVMLARDFVNKVKEVKIDTSSLTSSGDPGKAVTLWSALHGSIGGGWVHFVNCLLYSLESNYFSITAPLMERPKTSWKPKYQSEKYKRSKKWKYYIPVDQKQAQKEYYIKEKENQLVDLKDVPSDFIKLFLETNNKEYKEIFEKHDTRKKARIDLVKLLLATDYLSEPQIKYIRTGVQRAILQYSFNQLPTVIVFDNLDAAVVMSLNENGYNLEKIVFRNEKNLRDEEKIQRQQMIERNILAINKVNQKIFEARLKRHFAQ